jgi:hypothetical protein
MVKAFSSGGSSLMPLISACSIHPAAPVTRIADKSAKMYSGIGNTYDR